MANRKLIDVASFQGIINWDLAKKEIDGAILQAGYGSDFIYQDDSQYERNAAECERLGIPYGIYIYSYATTDAEAHSEASHAIRLARGKKLSYPVYFDAEQSGTENVAKRMADIFCKDIQAAGLFAGVYANTYWFGTYLSGLNAYTKWVADYGANNGLQNTRPPINGMDIWQYTSVGRISGITANTVDVNVCYRDFPSEINGRKVVAKAGEVSANGKSIKDIAKEVIKGKWGNGNKRGKKLSAAGFSQEEINAIQKKVNSMVYKAVAKQVISGKWGNGQKRIDKLKAAGYDDAAINKIQDKVNKLVGQ